jgi:hypothetical protein
VSLPKSEYRKQCAETSSRDFANAKSLYVRNP